MPLEWFYGPGVVLDISHLSAETAATVTDLKTALTVANHELTAHNIVLIHTGNDRLLGQRAYFETGPGVGADATRWLIEQGVRVMGINTMLWAVSS